MIPCDHVAIQLYLLLQFYKTTFQSVSKWVKRNVHHDHFIGQISLNSCNTANTDGRQHAQNSPRLDIPLFAWYNSLYPCAESKGFHWQQHTPIAPALQTVRVDWTSAGCWKSTLLFVHVNNILADRTPVKKDKWATAFTVSGWYISYYYKHINKYKSSFFYIEESSFPFDLLIDSSCSIRPNVFCPSIVFCSCCWKSQSNLSMSNRYFRSHSFTEKRRRVGAVR